MAATRPPMKKRNNSANVRGEIHETWPCTSRQTDNKATDRRPEESRRSCNPSIPNLFLDPPTPVFRP